MHKKLNLGTFGKSSSNQTHSQTYVTELDVKRKAAYVATLVLAALCAPIPAGVL